MGRQVHVDIVKLLFTLCLDGYGYRNIFPLITEPCLNGGLQQIRGVFTDDFHHQRDKNFLGLAHGLNGKIAGKCQECLVWFHGYSIHTMGFRCLGKKVNIFRAERCGQIFEFD